MRQQVRKQIGGLSQRCRELLRFGGRKTFSWWERLGVHITPVHFYQPIPDTRALGDDIWTGHSSLAGIDINQSAQMHLLEAFSKAYRHEYESFPTTPSAVPYEFHLQNGFFEAVDAEVLYSFIRHFKPRRLI